MIGYYNYTVWLTYGSLLSSMTGLLLGFCGLPIQSSLCLLTCAVLDTFDGKIARTKKDRTEKEKRYGIQIDSFSDFLAFGVLPCVVGYGLFFNEDRSGWMVAVYGIASCLLALAAMIRLANFNVEEDMHQSETDSGRKAYTGIPVIITAGIVPLLVAAVKLFDMGMLGFALYAAALPVFGLMFLLKRLRVQKPTGKRLIFLFFCGAVEVLLLLVCL